MKCKVSRRKEIIKIGTEIDDNGQVMSVFVVVNDEVRIVSAAAYALKVLQTEMMGEAAKAGFESEEDIVDFIRKLRSEKRME